MLGLDLETTGRDRAVDVPVSAALVDMIGGVIVRTRSFLINPGRPIPEEATMIHGITDEHARHGLPLGTAVSRLSAEVRHAAENGIPLVGMNLCYDLTMLDVQASAHLGVSIEDPRLNVLDALVLDRHVDRYRRGKRRLGQLALHYGVELRDAHDALGDAKAAVAVVQAIVRTYPELENLGLGELTRLQGLWHREWAEGYSSWCEREGLPPLDASDMEWPIAHPFWF